MSAKKILIVEDEAKLSRVLQLELEHEGYAVDTARSGKIGLEKAQQDDWDLILLDVMLPELNGLEVLRRIRAKNDLLPIILLTARDSLPDKVSGLDQGANDYITKPFQIEELLARIRAALRTSQTRIRPEEERLTAGELQVNVQTREVSLGDAPLDLTPREFDLLVYLLRNKNQVLAREQILSRVWGFDHGGDTNVVDVYVRYLRKKIDNGRKQSLIQTVRGVGYSLKEFPDEN